MYDQYYEEDNQNFDDLEPEEMMKIIEKQQNKNNITDFSHLLSGNEESP